MESKGAVALEAIVLLGLVAPPTDWVACDSDLEFADVLKRESSVDPSFAMLKRSRHAAGNGKLVNIHPPRHALSAKTIHGNAANLS